MRLLIAALFVLTLAPVPNAFAAKAPPPGKFLSDTLEGVFLVYPNLVHMTLQLPPQSGPASNRVTGQLRLEPLIEQRMGPSGPMGIVDASIDFDPATGMFTLTPDAGVSRLIGEQVPTFTGVVDTETGIGGGTASNKRGECPYFVLAPSNIARSTFMKTLSVNTNGGASMAGGLALRFGGGGNTDKIQLWGARLEDEYPKMNMQHTEIGAIFDVGRMLFRDDHFVKSFGKRYDEMGRGKLTRIYKGIQKLPPQQSNFPEERGIGAAQALMNAFIAPANMTDLRLSVAALRPISAWRAQALNRIAAQPATANTWKALAQLETADKTTLQSFWPSEHAALATAVADARTRIAPTLLAEEVESHLAKATSYASVADLGNLLGSMTAAPTTPAETLTPQMLIDFVPEQERQSLEARLSERRGQLVSAEVASQVESAAGYNGLQKLYNTRGTVQSIFSMSPAEQSAGQPVIASLDTKIRSLVVSQVASESADYQAFVSHSAGDAATLAEARERELKIGNAYSAFVRLPEFSDFNEARSGHRIELLTRNAMAIAARMTASQRMSEVRAIKTQYLLDMDASSPAAQPLILAMREREGVLEPFASLPGGDYFDAIYDGSYENLHAMDMEYVAGLKPLLDPFIQTIGRHFGADYEHMSMLMPVMTAYLTDYQNTYSKCLRPDRIEFEISGRTPDYVTTNGWGIEISRIYGHAYENRYLVNREFGHAFAQLGDSGSGSGGLMLTDVFLNQGKITKLLMGTGQLMSTYDCSDPRIKRLEANMMKLYNTMR